MCHFGSLLQSIKFRDFKGNFSPRRDFCTSYDRSRSNFVISKGTSHPGVIFVPPMIGLLIQEIKIGSLSSFEGNTFSFAPNK